MWKDIAKQSPEYLFQSAIVTLRKAENANKGGKSLASFQQFDLLLEEASLLISLARQKSGSYLANRSQEYMVVVTNTGVVATEPRTKFENRDSKAEVLVPGADNESDSETCR